MSNVFSSGCETSGGLPVAPWRRRVGWLLPVGVACLLLAAGVAGVQSFAGRSLPGCGDGSGCEAVLSSRWAWVGFVPVSGLGLGVYLAAALVGMGLWWRGWKGRWVDGVWTWAMIFLAAVVCGSAAWFLILSGLWIGAMCRYCLLAHAAGVAGVLLVVCASFGAGRRAGTRAGGAVVAVVAGGLLCVVALAVVQAVVEPPVAEVGLVGERVGVGEGEGTRVELPAADLSEGGPAAWRWREFLEGRVRVDLSDVALPVVGRRDAGHVVAVMFDYGCRHCRHAHELLEEARAELERDAGGGLAVVLLPVPLDGGCNPGFASEGRGDFADSCERSRVMLAVAALAPGELEAFDRWMFEPVPGLGFPRSGAEAFERAAAVAGGEEAVREAMESPGVARRLEASTAAWAQLKEKRIPVLAVPGKPPIIPRNGSDVGVVYDLLDVER